MSKICTDLKQSRKLIELGIEHNTADMHWWPNGNDFQLFPIPFKNDDSVPESVAKEIIPAWSLSALLELMPKIRVAAPIIVKALLEEKYYCHYQGIGTFKEVYTTTFHEEPTDAAFEMVVWLLENGYIKPIK